MWIPLWVLFDHPSFFFAPWVPVIPLCLMFNPLVSTSCFHHSWGSHFLSVLVTWLFLLPLTVAQGSQGIVLDGERFLSSLASVFFFNLIAAFSSFFLNFLFDCFEIGSYSTVHCGLGLMVILCLGVSKCWDYMGHHTLLSSPVSIGQAVLPDALANDWVLGNISPHCWPHETCSVWVFQQARLIKCR